MRFWHYKKRPTREFVEWCRGNPPTTTKIFNAREIHEAIALLKRHSQPIEITIDRTLGAETLVLDGGGIDYRNCITKLTIPDTTIKNLSIENVAIGSLSLEIKTLQVTIRNSAISRLRLLYGGVVLENCNIGTLALVGHPQGLIGTHELTVSGGCILDIECPAPWTPSPFQGPASFSNVFLPRNPVDYLIKGPQPYRNVRSHLRKLENSQGANLFHSAELAMERKTDSRANKVLGFLYETFSDYGSSTLRPLAWLVGLWYLSFLVIFLTDGATQVTGVDYSGWRAVLQEADCWGRFWRAMVLSLQQISSPLTILGAKTLLVAKYTWLASWSVIHSLLSVVLIALFVLAVRRRFKMQ